MITMRNCSRQFFIVIGVMQGERTRMYELTMSLNPKSKTPLYEQIYEFIKEEIQNNVIQSGERLPSTRALSKHLVVSRSTVELAYEQLLSEGYVEATHAKDILSQRSKAYISFRRDRRSKLNRFLQE